MFESGTYKSLSEHVALYESLKASMERANRDEFFAKKYKSRKRRRDDQDPPPSLPDSNLSKKKRHDYDASGSQQPPAPPSSAWETSDTREAPSSSSKQKSVPHSEQPVKDVPIPDDVNISDSEDTDTAQLPKIKTRLDWLKPANALASSYQDPDEYKLLRQTGGMSSFINWFCKRIEKKKLSKSDLEGPAFKVVRPFHYNNISLQFQMEECHLLLTDQVDLVDRVVPDVSKPLPLGGPPGQVTIQSQFFFNKALEYLVSGSKERRSAMSISKLKAASYPDFGLEELVPSLHSAPSDRHAVRSHMHILNVVILKTISRYGYTYLKEIVLRRADYKEYKISESDYKNMHPNDFEDLYLLHLQGKLNHLYGSDKVHLFNATKLNLIEPNWDAYDFLFKEDYIIVSKPRVIIYRDRNDQKKMMRETEVHKFSDGTLNRILDKLDHVVKDFKLFKYNPVTKSRIWSKDDRRRSKDFMEMLTTELSRELNDLIIPILSLQALSNLHYLSWSWIISGPGMVKIYRMENSTMAIHCLHSLRLPKSGNQLQFLIQRVRSGHISNDLSVPRKFSALMFSSLSSPSFEAYKNLCKDVANSQSYICRAILTNDVVSWFNFIDQGYAEDFYDQHEHSHLVV
ncbi:hypothetical protein Tco_1210614 [Tanacetum coccineum]